MQLKPFLGSRSLYPLSFGFFMGAVGLLCHLLVDAAPSDDDGQLVNGYAWSFAVGLYAAALVYCMLFRKACSAIEVVFALAIGALCSLIVYWRIFNPSAYSGESRHAYVAILGLFFLTAWVRVRFEHGSWTPDYAHWFNTLMGLFLSTLLIFAVTVLALGIIVVYTTLMYYTGIEASVNLLADTLFITVALSVVVGAGWGFLHHDNRVLFGFFRLMVWLSQALMFPLLIAIWLFLTLALLALGLEPFWQNTASTSLILLPLVMVVIVIANLIIRDGLVAVGGFLAVGAVLLLLSIVPLSVIALVSTAERVAQYGLTPDRIWAFSVAFVLASVGLSYVFVLLVGSKFGFAPLRQLNGWIVLFVSVLMLAQAVPVVDFGAISARNQLARLNAGALEPEQLDYASLAYDLGETGRLITDKLAKNGDPKAALAMRTANRYEFVDKVGYLFEKLERLKKNMVAYSERDSIPDVLLEALASEDYCQNDACALHFPAAKDQALLSEIDCVDRVGDLCFFRQILVAKKEAAVWEFTEFNPAFPSLLSRRDFVQAVKTGELQVKMTRSLRLEMNGQAVGQFFEWPAEDSLERY